MTLWARCGKLVCISERDQACSRWTVFRQTRIPVEVSLGKHSWNRLPVIQRRTARLEESVEKR